MPARTITYPDSLYADALLATISSANDYIYIAMFLFKASYLGETWACLTGASGVGSSSDLGKDLL